jgi:anti-sigma B factor antagonist
MNNTADHDVALRAERFGTDGVIVSASGELDVATADALRRRLRDAVEDGARRIVVDLCDVSFVDSLVLAALVGARRRLSADGRMAVAARHHYVLLVVEAAGLGELLDIVETRQEALARVFG